MKAQILNKVVKQISDETKPASPKCRKWSPFGEQRSSWELLLIQGKTGRLLSGHIRSETFSYGKNLTMTRIASIANNRLTLTDDLCGHSGLLPVTVAIEVFGKTETVDHITKRARCFRFKLKGQNILQIVHVWQG